MIEDCKSCGTKFNNETVGRCPACNTTKRRHGKNRSGKFSGIDDFRRSQIAEKKQVVNSFRRCEVTRYESQTGKKVFA